jgi:hypothetical protein
MQGVAYLSLRMEDVSNIGNVMYCVTFEQQEEHHYDVYDDNMFKPTVYDTQTNNFKWLNHYGIGNKTVACINQNHGRDFMDTE